MLFALVPRRLHVRVARILLNRETIVGGYVRGQVITSAAMFVFLLVLLSALRVKGALAVAAFAGLTDVLPFVGGLLATTPAVVATLASRGSALALVVLAVRVVYQELESRILVPRVYGRVLRLPAAAVLLALLAGFLLLGVVGALLALPVAAGLYMALRELRLELPGESGVDPELARRDAGVERATCSAPRAPRRGRAVGAAAMGRCVVHRERVRAYAARPNRCARPVRPRPRSSCCSPRSSSGPPRPPTPSCCRARRRSTGSSTATRSSRAPTRRASSTTRA